MRRITVLGSKDNSDVQELIEFLQGLDVECVFPTEVKIVKNLIVYFTQDDLSEMNETMLWENFHSRVMPCKYEGSTIPMLFQGIKSADFTTEEKAIVFASIKRRLESLFREYGDDLT